MYPLLITLTHICTCTYLLGGLGGGQDGVEGHTQDFYP